MRHGPARQEKHDENQTRDRASLAPVPFGLRPDFLEHQAKQFGDQQPRQQEDQDP